MRVWTNGYHELTATDSSRGRCVGQWTEIETTLGVILAVLLDASPKAALAMFASTENRSTQLKMISAAALFQIGPYESDLLDAILTAHVHPASKDRNKVAHWCWGHSPEIPDALLLTEATTKIALQHFALDAPSKPATDASLIYVVKKGDVERMVKRFVTTRECLLQFLSMLREKERRQRAAIFHQLSTQPPIAGALTRLQGNRQSTQATP